MLKHMAGYNPRRANSTRRNLVRKRVLQEETHCWLCLLPVDKGLPPGLPASPEVDEIIPVSRGGSPFDRANCKLSHRLCNQRRGNKPAGHGKVTALKPLKTSRQW